MELVKKYTPIYSFTLTPDEMKELFDVLFFIKCHPTENAIANRIANKWYELLEENRPAGGFHD